MNEQATEMVTLYINTINPAPITVAPTISLGTVSFTSPNPPVITLGETAHLTVNVTPTGVLQGTTVVLSISKTNVSGGITINVDPVTTTVTLNGNQTVPVDVSFMVPVNQSPPPTLPITLNGHAMLSSLNPQTVVLATGMGREKDSSNQLTIQVEPINIGN